MSHCDDCGVCIMELDHHCVFFDACIGKSNMMMFTGTICCFFAVLIFIVIIAAVQDHKSGLEIAFGESESAQN